MAWRESIPAASVIWTRLPWHRLKQSARRKTSSRFTLNVTGQTEVVSATSGKNLLLPAFFFVFGKIQMIIAESASAPFTSAAAQEDDLPRILVRNDGITFHFLSFPGTTDRIRHDNNSLIAFYCAYKGKPNSLIPAGRFNNHRIYRSSLKMKQTQWCIVTIPGLRFWNRWQDLLIP